MSFFPQLGSIRLSDLTVRACKRWLDKFDSPALHFVAYTTLRQVLNHAIANECLTVSPLDKVTSPKRDDYEPTVLDTEDIEVYLWHYRDTSVEVAVLLAIGAGLRRGEIVALNVSDINPYTGRVTIDNAVTQHGATIYEGTPKSLYNVREVYLPTTILSRLVKVLPKDGAVLQGHEGRMSPDRLTFHYRWIQRTMPEGVPRIPLQICATQALR